MRRSTSSIFLLLFPLIPFIAGCRSVATFPSVPGVRWSGMGLSFSLPNGIWRVEETDDVEGRHFASEDGHRHIVVMRKKAREEVPAWLQIRNVLVEFRAKDLLERRTIALPDYSTVEFAECLAKLENADMRLGVWVVRRSGYDVILVAWDASGGPVPDLLDAVRGLKVVHQAGEEGP